MSQKNSAYSRLGSMPEVLTLSSAMRLLGMDIDSTRVTLSRWAKAGMLQLAGPRAGIYYNLVANRNAAQDRLVDVIRQVHPMAVLSEASVLHSCGWTTQIPYDLSVNVEQRKTHPALFGVRIHQRSIEWFKAVKAHGGLVSPSEADFSTYGLPALKPAWALADMMIDPDAWHPDEDDLDIPDGLEPAVEEASGILHAVGDPSQSFIMTTPAGAANVSRGRIL